VRRCETVEKFGNNFVSVLVSGDTYVGTRRGLTVRQMWVLYQCLFLNSKTPTSNTGFLRTLSS